MDEQKERAAFEADWYARNKTTWYCERAWEGWKARAVWVAAGLALTEDHIAQARAALTAAPAPAPLTDERVRDAYMSTNTRTHDQTFAAFRDGVRFAERAHGIGTAAAPTVKDSLTPAAPQWQPIETAPRDGTAILLGSRGGSWIGKWLPVYASGYRPDNPWSSLMLNHDHMGEKWCKPTHWMPLPAAPDAARAQAQKGN